MSAYRGPASARADSAYSTPLWCLLAVLPFFVERIAANWRRRITAKPALPVIIDPCCGDGRVLKCLMDAGLPRDGIYGIDIREEAVAEARTLLERVGLPATDRNPVVQANYLMVTPAELWPNSPSMCGRGADAFLTNPPYGGSEDLAFKFVRRALEQVRQGGIVCMLLRANWFGDGRTRGRGIFLRRHAPDRYDLDERPSFTNDGASDASVYTWAMWTRGQEQEVGASRLLDCSTDAINGRLAEAGLNPYLTAALRGGKSRRAGGEGEDA